MTRMEAEDEIFGKDVIVYCKQHLRPHHTGWCTVRNDQKVPLDAKSIEDAYAECRVRGFVIFGAD